MSSKHTKQSSNLVEIDMDHFKTQIGIGKNLIDLSPNSSCYTSLYFSLLGRALCAQSSRF